MTLTADLRAAIEAHLDALGALPTAVARENTDFVPQTGTPWRRETLSPGPYTLESLPSSLGLLGFSGAYLVDFFFPVNGAVSDVDAAVDGLIDGCPIDQQLDLGNDRWLRFTGSRAAPGLRDGPWWMVPVELRFVVDGVVNAAL